MNRKSTPPTPEAIVQLQRQLDQFRSTQPRRTKLPESLWQAAVELWQRSRWGAKALAAGRGIRQLHLLFWCCPGRIAPHNRRASSSVVLSRALGTSTLL